MRCDTCPHGVERPRAFRHGREVMRSMRSRIPEKSELAAQLKRYRYDAGLKGDEAGAVIGKKATTVYKYEAGTLWVSRGTCERCSTSTA